MSKQEELPLKLEEVSTPKAKTEGKPGQVLVFTPYITRKGKRINHPTGGVFVFWADPKNVN